MTHTPLYANVKATTYNTMCPSWRGRHPILPLCLSPRSRKKCVAPKISHLELPRTGLRNRIECARGLYIYIRITYVYNRGDLGCRRAHATTRSRRLQRHAPPAWREIWWGHYFLPAKIYFSRTRMYDMRKSYRSREERRWFVISLRALAFS